MFGTGVVYQPTWCLVLPYREVPGTDVAHDQYEQRGAEEGCVVLGPDQRAAAGAGGAAKHGGDHAGLTVYHV